MPAIVHICLHVCRYVCMYVCMWWCVLYLWDYRWKGSVVRVRVFIRFLIFYAFCMHTSRVTSPYKETEKRTDVLSGAVPVLHHWSQSNLCAHSSLHSGVSPLTDPLSLSLSLCLSSYLQTTGIRWDNTHTHTLYKSRVLYKSHLKRANIRSNLVWPYWCFEMKRREVRLPKENTDELYRKACHLICSTRPHTQWLNRWIGQWPSKQHI